MKMFARMWCGLLLLALGGTVFAQDYPNRPIKLVVPWPPGQSTDLLARVVAERISQFLGQPVVVDNRAGAGGLIGSDIVAKSPPDGYTLLAASSGPISIMPALQKTPYDPIKSFAPVALAGGNPYLLVASSSFPAATAKELIEMIKANPNKYAFSSSGTGATSHLVSEHFNSQAGIAPTHVPYKGSSPSLTDVMTGQVTYTFETSAAVLPLLKSGRLKAYGVSSARRAITMPEVPPIAESADLPGFDIGAWGGYMAPAGTPHEIVAKISAAIQKALQEPATRDRLIQIGLDVEYRSPDQFAAFLAKEYVRYADIAKRANIRLD